jgi:hypothetical protein
MFVRHPTATVPELYSWVISTDIQEVLHSILAHRLAVLMEGFCGFPGKCWYKATAASFNILSSVLILISIDACSL